MGSGCCSDDRNEPTSQPLDDAVKHRNAGKEKEDLNINNDAQHRAAFLRANLERTRAKLNARLQQNSTQGAPSEDAEQTEEPEDPTALTRPHNLDFSSLGTSCVRIARTQDRGISVKQLRRVRDFIKHFANEHGELLWMDLAPAEFNVGRLCTQKINLYQVAGWIIKPATEPFQCSLIELLAEEASAQRPRTFVSHWWGEPTWDFVDSVSNHADVHKLGDDSCYWVCAYSNNQWALAGEIDPDPRKSSFYLAMELCDYVLLVLDENGTPFTRIWCIFEEGMWAQNLRKKGLKLDIAIMFNGRPELLTDGLTQFEQEEEAYNPGVGIGYLNKWLREGSFPLAVLHLGYGITAGEAEATQGEDKRRIINTINGCDPTQLNTTEPELDHFECDQVNRILRGVFAEASLTAAARADCKSLDDADDEEPNNLRSAMAVLAEDTERSKLLIDLRTTGITHTNELGAATLGRMQALTQLTISFFGCSGLVDISVLGEGLAQLKALQELNINFHDCSGLVDVSGVGEGLAQLKALTQLSIYFGHCPGLVDVSAVGEGLAQLKTLKKLTINFSGCSGLGGVSSFDANYLHHLAGDQKSITI